MSAQPGWYDTNQPGRQRWWDGTTWTEHERVAPPASAPAAPAVSATPAAAGGPQFGVAPGWYRMPSTGEVRWFTGQIWSGYALRDGKPRADNFTGSQRSQQLFVFGMIYLVLGMTQATLAFRNGGFIISASLLLLLSVMWSVGAARARTRERAPRPVEAPLLIDAARPMPGEAEGPSAGWYPSDQGRTRWWTGVRWSHYVAKAGEIEPVYGIERSLRIALRLGMWVTIAGAVLLALGIVLLNVGVDTWAGVVTLIAGIALLFAGGLTWIVFAIRARAVRRSEQRPVA